MRRMKNKIKKNTMRQLAVLLCCSFLLTALPFSQVSAAVANSETVVQVDTVSNVGTENQDVDANGTLGLNSDVGVEVTKSITGEAGKQLKVTFKLKSADKKNIKLKNVYPVIDAAFPFETSGDAYKVVSAGSNSDKQAVLNASFKMTARADLETGYHSVRFIGEYTKIGSDGVAADYYVIKTINIYFEGEDSGYDDGNDNDNEPDDWGSGDDDDDSYYGGNNNRYDDDDDHEVTAPKLIIDGYDTVPEKIMAGEEFTLTVHVRNTSKSTSLCNGKFLIGNEAGNFLPVSGSSAVFIDSIPAGKTGDLEIKLKTSADLAQKNYILVVKGDFDDGKGNNFTSSDSLSVPVYQEVKLGITDVSMSPDMLGIGTEASLMFTINNQGSAGVYNVNVSVKGDAVSAEESYVGNIAGSASAYATLNVVGKQDNSDTGMITVVISYEDSEGNVGELEQQVNCVVAEDYEGYEDSADGEVYDEFEDEDFEDGPNWILILVITLLVLIVIIVIVIVVIKKKKKHLAELLAEEDGEDDIENEDF